MIFRCRISHLFIFKLFLIQTIFADKICLKDGETTYEYDEINRLGSGWFGKVYKGKKIEGEKTDILAFKVAMSDSANADIRHEKDIYLKVGDHESIPKYYHYFPHTNRTKGAILVIELLGKDLYKLLKEFKRFSIVTIMKIGLQVLNALEHMHKRKVIHYDLHTGNFALGFNNDSRIYVLDFNASEEYEIVGDSFILKEIPFNNRSTKIKTPRHDLKALAIILIEFGGVKIKQKDGTEITDDEFHDLFGDAEGKETLTEFLQMARNSKYDRPDYEAFRNLLRKELEKHRNEPNYDKFDWQITDTIIQVSQISRLRPKYSI